jgi:hypothetical protein
MLQVMMCVSVTRLAKQLTTPYGGESPDSPTPEAEVTIRLLS